MSENIGDDFLKLIQTVNNNLKKKELNLERIRPFLNDFIQLKVVPKDGYITNEGLMINKVYYVISGEYSNLRISEQGKINIMARQCAPQFIGIDRAVNYTVASLASNTAITKCVVLAIDQKYFLECIKSNGEVAIYIIRNICDKLSISSYRSDQLLFNSSTDNLLLYIYEYWSKWHEGQEGCKLNMKNALIADDIGISTRTLYRAINRLKRDGLIDVDKGCIVVTYEQVVEIEKKCSKNK